MTNLMKTLVGGALLAGTSIASAAEVSGNITLATDYRFRGISQVDRSPAVQGGFDVADESGFYAGIWASNVNFTEAAIEIDYYGGYAGDINEEIGFDAGIVYYNYPHGPSSDLDYVEAYGSVSFAGATLGLNLSGDYFGETGDFIYFYGDYGIELVENVSLGLHVGLNSFDEDDFLGDDDRYLDYSVSISTEAAGLGWSAAYVDTDLDEDECFNNTKLCEDTLVLSVSKSL